jgi:hypothetical protein
VTLRPSCDRRHSHDDAFMFRRFLLCAIRLKFASLCGRTSCNDRYECRDRFGVNQPVRNSSLPWSILFNGTGRFMVSWRAWNKWV